MSRYIKTDALMEDIGSLYRDEDHTDYNVAIADALDVIDEQPTADVVERKCGEWIHYNDGDFDYDYKCSLCGYAVWDNSDYCPNCGADMRERREDAT